MRELSTFLYLAYDCGRFRRRHLGPFHVYPGTFSLSRRFASWSESSSESALKGEPDASDRVRSRFREFVFRLHRHALASHAASLWRSRRPNRSSNAGRMPAVSKEWGLGLLVGGSRPALVGNGIFQIASVD